MKFGVLGPYLIFPGRPHRVQAAKHRNLLAILTVNANAFVSVDRLADELWLGAPPLSAPNLVRQYISSVRRALPETGLIATMPSGYRLLLHPGDLDRDEFDAFVELARAELAANRLDPGVEALAEALRQWRGEPLADVDASPSVTAEARRLGERRLAAVELRIEAELRRGRYGEVVDELAALVTLHPKRERLRVCQMRALHATGRRADALAAYRESREALVDGVGIEPGRELQDVHRKILNDELPVESRAPVAVTRRPAQLPADVPDLVGRDHEVARVAAFIARSVGPAREAATPPVVIISGKAGVGKSVLAVRIGHRLIDRFPDGQLFLPMSEYTPAQALRRALRSLGAPTPDPAAELVELREEFHSRARGQRLLIVLDGVAHERDARPLIPPGSQSAVLVTSRSVLAGIEGGQHLGCPPLSEDAAARMLTGIIGDDRAAAEPDAVRELVNALGRLPLALRIAGGVLVLHRHQPVGFLLDRLRTRNPLDELSHGDLALRPRLAASYGQLTEVEQHVFRRVGAVAGANFDIGTAAEVAGVGPEIVEKAIDRLLEMHLVEPAGSGNRFRMDGIVHAYARERLSEHD